MSFNFQGLANALALVSFGLAGAIMAGSMLFPETAARYKRQIPYVIIGLNFVTSMMIVLSKLASGSDFNSSQSAKAFSQSFPEGA